MAMSGLCIALVFPTLVRLRLLDLPLERDEGEYAYAGQLMLQGVPPYELVYNMKFPGVYALYAAILGIFGETVAGIRLGVLAVTTLSAVLLYVLAARLFGRGPGVVTAAAAAILSLTPDALALYGHATHFIVPFVVGAMVLLCGEFSSLRLFGAGALLAMAVLMKQPAVFFVGFALLYVAVVSRRRVRDLAIVTAGGALVAGITAAALAAAGVFDRFWFWCVQYAGEYATAIPLNEGLGYLGRNLGAIVGFAPAIWLLAAAGAVLLWRRGTREQRLMVIGLLVAGALATTPGFYFRSHYFIVLFPAVALLAGAVVRYAPQKVSYGLAVAAIVATMAMDWPRLMESSSESITRQLYGTNPFIEAQHVAEHIREHTLPSDRVVVLGSEPQIYFLSGRRSATGYIYAYPLMEQQPFAPEMQREMIAEIERAKPKYVVFVGTSSSWLRQPRSNLMVLDWFSAQSNRWALDGIVDIAESGAEYVWGERAKSYRPRSESFLLVFRRES